MDCKQLLQLSVTDFAAATASKSPAPGGGAVSAVAAQLATALGEMAVAFSRDSKKFADRRERLDQSAALLARARGLFAQLAVEDAEAFGQYEHAAALADNDPAKADAKALALVLCINVPRETAKLALRVLEEMNALTALTSRWLISDLAAGAVLAEGVVRLADLNVRINTAQMADRQAADELRASSTEDCRRAAALMQAVHSAALKAIDGQ